MEAQLSAYATLTSASVEASVAYDNKGSVIGIKNVGSPSTCKFQIYSTSQITRANGTVGNGGGCGEDVVFTAKKRRRAAWKVGKRLAFPRPVFFLA